MEQFRRRWRRRFMTMHPTTSDFYRGWKLSTFYSCAPCGRRNTSGSSVVFADTLSTLGETCDWCEYRNTLFMSLCLAKTKRQAALAIRRFGGPAPQSNRTTCRRMFAVYYSGICIFIPYCTSSSCTGVLRFLELKAFKFR